MPWNDQSNGGPWGGQGGRGGPWGQGPRGGGPRGPGQQPPDLEDVIRQLQGRMRGIFGGGKGGGGGFAPAALLIALALIVWVVWPGSGWYIVQPNEVGVVLRFGKFHREDPNGFHLKLPFPIERAETPTAQESRSTPIDGSSAVRRGRAGPSPDTLMLTGDGNIVDLQFTVQWEIGDRPGDVANYLFEIDEPEQALISVSESAMREVIGQTPLQPILANEIGDIRRQVQTLIQDTLDEYKSGIQIRNVIIERPTLPSAENQADRGNVERDPLAAFRDVENAEQERQRSIEDARAYANRVVPVARGEAEQIIQQANAYRDSVIAEAAGQSERFRLVYEQYRLAPEVTRQRMFLETLEKVLGRSEKVILDDQGGQGVVPYLPLNELNRRPAGGSNR